MSEASTLDASWRISAACPTSSSDHHLARRSAPPTARERALRTITSSGNGPVSSSKSDLCGARLRIALAQELQASTGYSMRWRKHATPSGHSWWGLTMPERTTGESDYGSLLPTPSASEYGSNRGGAQGRTGELRPSRGSILQNGKAGADLKSFIPTPRAGDATRGPDPTSHSPNLQTFIPTPRGHRCALDGGSHAREKLTPAMILTPTAKGNMDAPAMAKWPGRGRI